VPSFGTDHSDRPRGLKHELSSPTQTLGSWFESHSRHGCLCSFILFMLFCVQIEALRRADPPSKESYRLCIRLRNWKSSEGPTKGCKAIDRQIDIGSPVHHCVHIGWLPRAEYLTRIIARVWVIDCSLVTRSDLWVGNGRVAWTVFAHRCFGS
jgi:hypothetical protein